MAKRQRVINEDGTITCAKCNESKVPELFHKNGRSPHGRCWVCKSCTPCRPKTKTVGDLRPCSRCKQDLPLSSYYRPTYSTCKPCTLKINAAHRVRTFNEAGELRCSRCLDWKPTSSFKNRRGYIRKMCDQCRWAGAKVQHTPNHNGEYTCSSCNCTKPPCGFGVDKRSPSGLKTECKVCMNMKHKQYLSATPERYFAAKNKIGNNDSQRRASLDRTCMNPKYLAALFEKQQGLCAITGVPMTHMYGAGRVLTNASIDRINGEDGYVDGNVRLLCDIVNVMRHTLKDQDFYAWCKLVCLGMEKQYDCKNKSR
jgi:hypothetical protein